MSNISAWIPQLIFLAGIFLLSVAAQSFEFFYGLALLSIFGVLLDILNTLKGRK